MPRTEAEERVYQIARARHLARFDAETGPMGREVRLALALETESEETRGDDQHQD